MLDATMLRTMFSAVRTHLPAACVQVRVDGNQYAAVRGSADFDSKRTEYGFDAGYAGTILFDSAGLPASFGSKARIDVLEPDNQWKTYRVLGLQLTGGTMYTVDYGTEYK